MLISWAYWKRPQHYTVYTWQEKFASLHMNKKEHKAATSLSLQEIVISFESLILQVVTV